MSVGIRNSTTLRLLYRTDNQDFRLNKKSLLISRTPSNTYICRFHGSGSLESVPFEWKTGNETSKMALFDGYLPLGALKRALVELDQVSISNAVLIISFRRNTSIPLLFCYYWFWPLFTEWHYIFCYWEILRTRYYTSVSDFNTKTKHYSKLSA